MSGAVLVTGGAGFIGSHLVDALLARGDEVVVLDDFNDYYAPAVKRDNLASALATGRCRVVEGGITDPASLDAALSGGVTRVVHLAARAGVRPSVEGPRVYADTNVAGTVEVLEALRRHGLTHAVLASSSSVYGATTDPPFAEDAVADAPVSPYAATKRAMELVSRVWSGLHGLNLTVLRYFTVYGPRQRPDMAIHRFARAMLASEPITLYGDGSSARDYTYVSDIVHGTLAALDRRPDGAGRWRVYNLGGGRVVGLLDLVRAMGDALGVEPIIQWGPDQPGDVPLTAADLARARAELEYAPEVRLEDGLARFAAWLNTRSG